MLRTSGGAKGAAPDRTSHVVPGPRPACAALRADAAIYYSLLYTITLLALHGLRSEGAEQMFPHVPSTASNDRQLSCGTGHCYTLRIVDDRFPATLIQQPQLMDPGTIICSEEVRIHIQDKVNYIVRVLVRRYPLTATISTSLPHTQHAFTVKL